MINPPLVTWLPADLMDEMIPPPRNSPDDWVGSLDDGAPAIIAGVDDGGTAEKICLLRDGDTVKFCSMTAHGSAILTLKTERQWSVDRPMPPGSRTGVRHQRLADQVTCPFG